MVGIYNKWSTINYDDCPADSGQEQVMDSDEKYDMTDNGDTTYSYTFTPTRPGDISIFVLKVVGAPIQADFWYGTSPSGDPAFSKTVTVINDDWGLGAVFLDWFDYWSARYNFFIRGPVTGDVDFRLIGDSNATLYIDGNEVTRASFSGSGTGS